MQRQHRCRRVWTNADFGSPIKGHGFKKQNSQASTKCCLIWTKWFSSCHHNLKPSEAQRACACDISWELLVLAPNMTLTHPSHPTLYSPQNGKCLQTRPLCMAVYLALLTHVTCNKAEDKGHNDGKLYKMGMKLINELRISIYTPYEVPKKSITGLLHLWIFFKIVGFLPIFCCPWIEKSVCVCVTVCGGCT